MEISNKNGIIKFAWRHNLIYPIQLLIWTFLRKIDTILLDNLFGFSISILFTLLMFLGELFGGLILYFYHRYSMKNKEKKKKKQIFYYKRNKIKGADSIIKIICLLFLSSFFDFIEFILSTYFVPKFLNSSGSLELRLGGILTISSALFFYYLLKFNISRHQFFSLLIIGICLLIVILTEFCFQDINIFITYGYFILKIVLIFFVHFFNSLLDSIEKYIIEYDFFDYFLILGMEGFFGFLITLIYSGSDKTLIKQIYKIYSDNSRSQFASFILLLLIYLILCGGRNAFRIVTNKIYSPMTKSLTDYFLNPIHIIINYFKGDFVSGGKQNIIYFLINIILSIVISLCGCVYNEIIILFFCGFERDTYDQISFRSFHVYKKELSELNDEAFKDKDDESENSKAYKNKNSLNNIVIY